MRRPVILIEGPDGAGKSTLAGERVREWEDAGHDVVYVHNDSSDARLPGRLDRHYAAQLLDAAERWDRDQVVTVIDRSYLSEVVYGEVYRGRSRVTPRQLRRLERLARRLGVVRLAVRAPWADRRARIEARGEEPTKNDIVVGVVYNQLTLPGSGWITVERGSANALN